MKSLSEFKDYKDFVRAWIKKQPRNGHGELRRIASHLNTSTVTISHIFSGPRNLSMEQALELCGYMGLNSWEEDLFLLYVEHERAGSMKWKLKIGRKIEKFKADSRELKRRLPKDSDFDDQAKARFYSHWYYSAVRNLTAIEDFQMGEGIAPRLGLSRARVNEILEFLAQHGLVKKTANGYLTGPAKTHLGSESPLVNRHHANWRLKAIENMENTSGRELFYTGPMTLSLPAMEAIRTELVELLARVIKIVDVAPSEELACLNIDWFLVRR